MLAMLCPSGRGENLEGERHINGYFRDINLVTLGNVTKMA